MFNTIINFFENYAWHVTLISTLIFLLSLISSIAIIINLPADNWIKYHQDPRKIPHSRFFVLRNILSVLLFVLGFLMLFLPGQGVLTILIAVFISDLPYRQRIINWIISQDKIQMALNRLRKRFNKEPFIF
ncbi:MAG: hypothetical protein OEW87_12640, partial [Flavobacteriaceae bacterium]|nr:hypothetical protein [Flavobacteriaceae bacterium]